ncbi:MAG: Gldg family protein [Thermodesulfobacteriota bacterium]
MKSRLTRIPKGILTVILTGAVLLFINILINDFTLRLDATENNIYSLSEATHKIIDKSSEEITLKYFNNSELNSDLPGEYKAYSKRIEDLLKEYQTYSKGRINLEVIRPRTDSQEEDNALTLGLQGVSLPGGEKLYMGLAAIKGDKEEIIPFFDPSDEAKLEYEITSLISSLQTEKKPEITFMSSIPVFGNPQPMQQNQQSRRWYFLEVLEKQYNIKQIDEQEGEIPGTSDALILFQPKNPDSKIIKNAEKYLENGGRVIVLADPLAILDQQSRMQPYSFPLKDTFEKWGIKFNEKESIADLNTATQIMGRNNQPELNPGWLTIESGGMSSKNIITSDLETLLFPIAGSIHTDEKKGLNYEKLLWSSKNSTLYDPSMLQFGGLDSIKRNFTPDENHHSIAVKITGDFSLGKNENAKKGALIFIAETDFLYDQFYMQKQNFLGYEMANMFNDNLTFFQNCVEIICGEEELIDIRSGSSTLRPFTKVKKLENKAKEKWLETEKKLTAKAEETSKKLKALEQQRAQNQSLVLSKEQEAEIEKFRKEKREVNNQLKQVRRKLRSDIESLGTKIKMINILLIPFIIGVIGIINGIRRHKK